jgi:hypothetical protein
MADDELIEGMAPQPHRVNGAIKGMTVTPADGQGGPRAETAQPPPAPKDSATSARPQR